MGAELIRFRGATAQDAGAIAAIHEAAWRSTYQGIIPHPHLERMIARHGPLWWQRQIERGARVMLLVFDEGVEGYASWGRARGAWPWPAGEIYELYLAPVFQGVGLGGRLFSTVRHRLRGEGLSRLVVWALRENEAACAFYGRLGGTIAVASAERYGTACLTRVAFLWGVRVSPSRG